MCNFFNGWRRKAGVVTLGLACMLTAVWVRSLTTCDVFTIHNRNFSHYRAWSERGSITFDILGFHHGEVRFRFWEVLDVQQVVDHFGKRTFSIHYWAIVMPLIGISACLLLIKSRSPKPPEST